MCQCKDFQLFIILQKKKSKYEDFFQEYCVRKMDDKSEKKNVENIKVQWFIRTGKLKKAHVIHPLFANSSL